MGFLFFLIFVFCVGLLLKLWHDAEATEPSNEPPIKYRYENLGGLWFIEKWYPYTKWQRFNTPAKTEEEAKDYIRTLIKLEKERLVTKYVYYDGEDK